MAVIIVVKIVIMYMIVIYIIYIYVYESPFLMYVENLEMDNSLKWVLFIKAVR